MEAEIIEAKPRKSLSLSEVNEKLLRRLDNLIENADTDEILKITEAIAKLNSSYKSNNQFGDPISDEERMERERKDLLSNIMEV